MAHERQGGFRQQNESVSQLGGRRGSQSGPGASQHPPNLPQGSSFKSNMSQQSLPEPDRETPPPQSKGRDDYSDIDTRALVQRYEELRMFPQKMFFSFSFSP